VFAAFKEEDVMPTSHSRQTSGTTHRAARQMSGRGHVFELTDEVRTLRGELAHTSGGRAAKTLAKTDGLRVTLVLLTSGATLNPESTAGGASLHVLEGRVRVQAEGERWDLGPGDLIVLGENLREPVTAMEEAAFLVTVAWPAGAGASEQKGAEVSS
jgi:quercetin dioxygenase-like cupin family protein